MSGLSALSIGIIAVGLGLGVFLVAWLIAEWAARRRLPSAPLAYLPLVGALPPADEALVVTQPGGRVAFINERAREWFGLDGSTPRLDLLARRAIPSESFYRLCAAEGTATFSLGGRAVEAVSHAVPVPGASQPQMVIVLRPAAPFPSLRRGDLPFGEAIRLIADLGQAMSASLDPQATLEAVLQSVRKAVACDAAEAVLWDDSRRALVPHAILGAPPEWDPASAAPPRAAGGCSAWLATHRAPLLVPKFSQRPDVRLDRDPETKLYRSFLGVPLEVGAELVGTLELLSAAEAGFDEADMTLLRALAGPAATAIRNAQRHAGQAQQAEELFGITQVSQVVAAAPEPRDLFGRLTAAIARQMRAELCGFLLYDEAEAALVGQPPFFGLPDPIVDLYRIPVPDGSPAHRLWRERDAWIAADVLADPLTAEIGLTPLAQAAGMRDALFVPVVSRGRRLGLLHVANRKGRAGFDDADAGALAAFAAQAAVALDNLRLMREARERDERAEGLRRIADTVASAASLDDVLISVLAELARSLRADRAAVLLLDETRGEIRPHVASAVGGHAPDEVRQATLRADDAMYRFSVTHTRRPFLTNRAPSDRRVLRFYRPLVERMQLRSVIDVPLVSQDRGLGELMLGKREGAPFTRADLELALTVAGQLAGAIERARLVNATDADLRRRVEQLTSLIRVGSELNQTLDLERVLRLVHDEAVRTTHADSGSILLYDLDAPGDASRATTRVGEGPAYEPLPAPLTARLAKDRSACVADFDDEDFAAPQPGIRSGLIVPIEYQGGTVGLIQLYAAEPGRFDAASAEIALALAAQAAVAVGNSVLFGEQVQRGELLRRRADALAQLFQISRTVRSDQPLADSLTAIALGVQEATGYNRVLIGVLDPAGDGVEPMAGAGVPLSRLERLRAARCPWASLEALFRPEFRLSQSYVVPASAASESAGVLQPLLADEPAANDAGPSQHLLFVPLYGSGGKPVGVMNAHDPRPGASVRPDRPTLETLEIFANQAAIAVENARLVASLEGRASELTDSLDSLQKSYRALDEASASLVHKDEQLSQAVEELDQRSQRLLAIHRIAEALADLRDADAILRQFAESTRAEMGMSACLVSTLESGHLRLPASAGEWPAAVNLDSLLGQRNPLRSVAQGGGETLIEPDVAAGAWKDSPLLNALELRSFVCLPWAVEGRHGAVLIGSKQAGTAFRPGDRDLFAILIGQLTVTLEKARLFNETAARLHEVNLLLDFSRQLGGLDVNQTAESLVATVAQAIPAAEAVAYFGFEPESGTLRALAGRGYPQLPSLRAMRLSTEDRESLAGKGFASIVPVRWPTVDVVRDLNMRPENLGLYREANAGRLPASALAVPLTGTDRQMGVLVLEAFARPSAFGEGEQAVAASLAAQAAVAIHNALLYRQTLELTSFNEAVFQSIQQGIAVLDTAGRVLQINEFIRATYGWDDSIIGQNVFEARPIFRDIGLEKAFRQILETGRPMERFRVTHPDREGKMLVRNFYGYPLRHSGQVAGVVVLVEDITERARLEEDVRERAAQLESLAHVSRAITASLRREDIIGSLLGGLRQVLDCGRAALWLRDGERLRVAAAQGYEDDRERLGLQVEIADSALFSQMLATRAPVYVPDVQQDERFALAGEMPGRCWLGVPLILQDRVAGAFAIEHARPHAYRPQHVQMAETFAGQAAVALENARLYEESIQRAAELDTRSQRLALLNRLSAAFSSTLQVERILQMTLAELASALHVEQAGAILFDERAAVGRLLAEVPAGPAVADIEIPLAGNPAIERVRQSLTPLAVEDVETDPLVAPVRETLRARGVRSILIIPLVVGGEVVGTLGMDSLAQPRRFTAGEIELAQTIANQAAVGVQNARLYNETQQRLIELATINQISRAISSAIDSEQVLAVLQMQLGAVMNTDSLYVARFDAAAGQMHFPLAVERGERLTRPPQAPGGLVGRIVESKTSLLLTGPDAAARLNPLGLHAADLGAARSFLGVPMLLAEQVVGVLAVLDLDRADAFHESHERILSTIASQAAVAFENARLYEETRALTRDLERRVADRTRDVERERDRVEALLRITSELAASLDLDRVLARALTLVNDAVVADQSAIFLLDPQSDQLIYRAALGRNRPLPLGGEVAPFRRDQGLVGWVIQNREPAVIGDLQHDPRWINLTERQSRHQSAIAVPLIANEDVLGALILLSQQREAFDAVLMKLVAAAANQVASAINNAELYRLIRDQAERLGAMLRAQQVEASKSRAILEAVADGVMVADAGGKVILFNLAAERILRLSRHEVLGRPVSDLVGIYGAASRNWASAIAGWAADPGSYRPGDFLAERLTLDDKRVVSVHLAPVTAADDFLGSVSVFRDISREVEVDRLKSEFVATVSHELRTPMTSIKGYADLLLMGAVGGLPPEQARFVEVIRSNADRLSILVNDLLDISRIESGRVTLHLEALDLREIAGEAVEHLLARVRHERKPLEVIADFAADLPPVVGDRDRVRQILTNLVDNAFLYTPEGGRVTVRLTTSPGAVQVDVADTGIGIPAAEQVRVFDRFYRGEDPLVLASAGTGLGLSIVQHLVEMHGGHIWVASEGVPGRGSTFSFLLPLTQDAPMPEPAMGT